MERKIYWESRSINKSGPLAISGDIAEVRFFYNNQSSADVAVINQGWKLGGYNIYTLGGTAQKYPFELILINNKNEVDETTYNILLPPGDELTVLVKYLKPDPCAK